MVSRWCVVSSYFAWGRECAAHETTQPARVTAHTVPTDAFPQRTVILIKLDQKVMDREEALGK